MLSEWASERVGPSGGQASVAWLSLDAEDNDPVCFWTYLVAALQEMEGRDDVSGFLSAFAGSHRYVLDCLTGAERRER